MPFNTALSPLANSLQGSFCPIHDYGKPLNLDHLDGWPSDLGLRWSEGDLPEFKKLKPLAFSAASWTLEFYSYAPLLAVQFALSGSLKILCLMGA